MRLARTVGPVAPVVLVVGVLAGMLLSPYYLFLATSAAIGATVARSVGLLTGQIGMISLCQMSFSALGGAAVAELAAKNVSLPFPLEVLIGGIAAVPAGLLIGLPALRVRGINLAVVTLSFAVSVDLYFNHNGFPGSAAGVGVSPDAPFNAPRAYYYLCLAVFLLVCTGLSWLERRRVGSAWFAVRRSERAAAALGLGVARTKLGAFALGAFTAGLGGGLIAGQLSLLTPETFAPLTSLVVFAGAVVFGARRIEGATLAGVAPVAAQEIVQRLSLPLDIVNFLFGIAVIDVLRHGRGGVADQLRAVAARRAVRPAPGARGELRELRRLFVRPSRSLGPPLTLTELTVRYGELLAVDRLNLVLASGSVFGLIGPNGAGKSTVIDAVSGFVPYEGSVLVDGVSVDGMHPTPRAQLGIRRTFQQDRTIPDLTVEQYVRLASSHRLSPADVHEAIAFVDGPAPGHPISQLDVGTRRLVEVAGVLASRPHVVLLDEPAAGLGPAESRLLAQRIAEAPLRFGCGVLLIEHDMDHVREACSEVTVLDFGCVIASGSTHEVLRDPAVVAAYLGEAAVPG